MADDLSALSAPEPQPAPTGSEHSTQIPDSASPVESAFSLRDGLSGAGYDTSSYSDDKSAFQAILEAVQRGSQNEQYAHYGQQYAAHQNEFNEWLKAKDQPQQHQPQQVAQPAASSWKAPEWQDDWKAYVRRDPDTGRYVPNGPYDPGYAHKANEWEKHKLATFDRLARDPHGMMKEGLADWVKEVAAQAQAPLIEQIRTLASQAHEQEKINKIVGSNSSWLYQKDAGGQQLRDLQGRPVLSPRGQQYAKAVERLQNEFGIVDPDRANQLALELVGSNGHATSANPVQSRQESFLASALQGQHQPNRNGTTVAAALDPLAPVQNPEASFLQMALAEARSRGVQGA